MSSGIKSSRVVVMVVVVALLASLAVAAAVLLGDGDDPAPADPNTADEPAADEGQDSEREPVARKAYLRDACELPARWVERIYRGWSPGATRDADLVIVPKPPNYMGTFINTSHSGPYDFLQDVPLVFYGPGVIRPTGPIRLDREPTLADLAPTYAELMDFDGWPSRPQSKSLTEVLEDSADPPKLIFTAVIDGGGWNVLDLWDDRWPNLRRLMEEGASIERATVGSSPSITPATHTNIGTGTFPRAHGVSAIAIRADDGDLVGSFSEGAGSVGPNAIDPDVSLRRSTLADLWDRAQGNEAEIGILSAGNLMLGMMGQGTAFPGGDRDIVALKSGEQWATDEILYSLPSYVNTEVEGPEGDVEDVDRMDGEVDGRWLGHGVEPLDGSPAFAPWQNRTMQAIFEGEGFGRDEITDLFYVNYKAPDKAGHTWNMIAPEQGDVIESVDDALGDMVEWLDRNVGRGEYVMVVTADHGQTPLEAGGWPILRSEVVNDVNDQFQEVDRALIQRTSASSFFSNHGGMKANGTSPEEVSSFLSRYTIGENVPDGDEIPEGYEDRTDERIFSAVFPGSKLDRIVACTGVFEESP